TANWNHRVDCFQTDLYWLVYRLTPNYARCNFLNCVGHFGVQRTFTVDWVTECVNNATEQFRTNRYFKDTASTLTFLAFGHTAVITQDYSTNGVALQVQCHTVDTAFKFNHLTVHNIGETVNTNNTVSYGNDSTFVLCFC